MLLSVGSKKKSLPEVSLIIAKPTFSESLNMNLYIRSIFTGLTKKYYIRVYFFRLPNLTYIFEVFSQALRKNIT